MNKLRYLLILMLAISACKSSKNITATTTTESLSYETVAAGFQSQLHEYHTASFKAKVDVKEKKTQSFSANVRMVRDSIIWASLTGTLGVEGARIIITKDSILIIDKLKKVYYQKPFSYVYEFVPFPVTMNLLQDILLGNHKIDAAAEHELKIDDTYIITEKGKDVQSEFFIQPATFVPLLVKMSERQQNRNLSIAYKDYRPASDTDSSANAFSFHRNVDFKSGKKIKIDIKFLRVEWGEDLTFPFSVGEKYEIRF